MKSTKNSHAPVTYQFKGKLLCVALTAMMGVSTTIAVMSDAQAQAVQQTAFNIPAASLSAAIAAFGLQSGLQITYLPELVTDKRSAGVSGTMSANSALQQILQGSGLTYTFMNANTVSLSRAGEEAGSGTSGNAMVLGTITVTGGEAGQPRANQEVTEGTGQYAAKVGVTALPFRATLRETPQSVSVITNQVIEDKKLSNFLEAVASAPGIAVRQYESNRATINARGMELNDYLIDGMATTTVFDGRYTAGEVFNDLSIYDRVEIVRGSAGLTSGTGNPSAVINLIRKKADSREFKGTITAEVGSWSHYGGMADISTPITKSGDTRARFVVNYKDKDSYIDLLNNKTQTLYATVEQDVTNQTRVSVGISHQKDESKGVMWGGLPAWAGQQFGTWEPLPMWDKSKTTAADWTRWDVDYTNWFASAEHTFDNGWKAKANYSHGERNSTAKLLMLFPFVSPTGDGSGVRSAGIYSTDQKHDGVNLQVDGDVHLFNRVHQLAFGADYSTQESESYNQVGGSLTNGNINTWTGENYPEPTFYPKQFARRDEEEKKSLYAAGKLTIFDPLKVTIGGRYVNYNLTNTAANLQQGKVEFSKFIPYAGVIYEIVPQLSIYSSYTRILQPQNVRDTSGNVLNPVKGNNKEIGLKGQFFDNRLNVNIAWFKTARDNQKIYDQLVGGEARYKESKDAEAKGYEIEISGEILPNWQVTAGYTKVNATYHNDIADATTISYNEKLDATLIPEKQFKLSTSYQMPGSWSGLTIGGGVTWQSETSQANPASLFGFPLYDGVATRQGGYAVADLMVRYQVTKQLSAQLNINNLFDKEYYGITEDALQVYRLPTRSALLTLKYQF